MLISRRKGPNRDAEGFIFAAFTVSVQNSALRRAIFRPRRTQTRDKFAGHEHPKESNRPIDANLAVFTGLGNTSRIGEDNLPADQWQQMNGELIGCVTQMSVESGKLVVAGSDGERTSSTPFNFFLSRVLYPANANRDFLDVLADVNGNLYNR